MSLKINSSLFVRLNGNWIDIDSALRLLMCRGVDSAKAALTNHNALFIKTHFSLKGSRGQQHCEYVPI
jgi:hypothetical protein